MTKINLNDYVNQFVIVIRRDCRRLYGKIEINDSSESSVHPFIFDLGSGGICYTNDGRCLFDNDSDYDIIQIGQVDLSIEHNTIQNHSSFLEWFTSEYGQYSFRSEAFIADCEIKDERILKLSMFKWLQAAYEAGTHCKVEQES